MDSNTEKKVFEEEKPEIKQETVLFQIDTGVTARVNYTHIIIDTVGRQYRYRHNAQNQICRAEFDPAPGIKVTMEGLAHEMQDSAGQMIETGVFTLVLVFTSLGFYEKFKNSLTNNGYTINCF